MRRFLILTTITTCGWLTLSLNAIDRAALPADPYERWQAQTTGAYQMTVVGFSVPVPPAALRLTVRDGEIVEQSIIACDAPTEEFPEGLCEPTRTYYTYLAQHTIEELFEDAALCLERTRTALADCPEVPADFVSFPDVDQLVNVGRSCAATLSGLEDTICAVQYNAIYGYPEKLTYFAPGVSDGFASITVRDFQFLDE